MRHSSSMHTFHFIYLDFLNAYYLFEYAAMSRHHVHHSYRRGMYLEHNEHLHNII